MAERPSTSLLNDGQTRHLLAVMTNVDDLLRRAEDLCNGPGSPFAREVLELPQKEAV